MSIAPAMMVIVILFISISFEAISPRVEVTGPGEKEMMTS